MAKLSLNDYKILSCKYDEQGYPNGLVSKPYVGTITQGSNEPYVLEIVFNQDIENENYKVGLATLRPDGSTTAEVVLMSPVPNTKNTFRVVLTNWYSRYYGELKFTPLVFKDRGEISKDPNIPTKPLLAFRTFYINVEESVMTTNQINEQPVAPDLDQFVVTSLSYDETFEFTGNMYINNGGNHYRISADTLKKFVTNITNKQQEDINQLKCDVQYDNIGIMYVDSYDKATGIVKIAYNPSLIRSMTYDKATGKLKVSVRPRDYSCNNGGEERPSCDFDSIKYLQIGLSEEDVARLSIEIEEKAVAKAIEQIPNELAKNYVKSSQKGAMNGVATLGEDGKIPSSQLPSYVDEVIEGNIGVDVPPTTFIATDGTVYNSTNASGKIFIDITTNKSYRWSGTQFTEIASGGSKIEVNNGEPTTDTAETLKINDVNYKLQQFKLIDLTGTGVNINGNDMYYTTSIDQKYIDEIRASFPNCVLKIQSWYFHPVEDYYGIAFSNVYSQYVDGKTYKTISCRTVVVGEDNLLTLSSVLHSTYDVSGNLGASPDAPTLTSIMIDGKTFKVESGLGFKPL